MHSFNFICLWGEYETNPLCQDILHQSISQSHIPVNFTRKNLEQGWIWRSMLYHTLTRSLTFVVLVASVLNIGRVYGDTSLTMTRNNHCGIVMYMARIWHLNCLLSKHRLILNVLIWMLFDDIQDLECYSIYYVLVY